MPFILPRAGASDDGLFRDTAPVRTTAESPVVCLVVDAEEDFDWDRPVQGGDFSTDHMLRITDLHQIVSAYGVRPTYMLTYPLLQNASVVRTVLRQHERGQCDVGIQMHPWVTPPFAAHEAFVSYLGNLSAASEERKLVALMTRFQEVFGHAPVTFRAGRYGLSASTTRLLAKYQFTVDTSVAPRTDFRPASGPDFSRYECDPFWFEGGQLLELPLCRSLIGWGARLAPWAYRAASAPALSRWRAQSVLSRSRFAERVTLSPEGNDFRAVRRFLRQRLKQGQKLFSLSFHSSSLWPGRNPYVRSREDLHVIYDRLSASLDEMSRLGFRFATLREMPQLLERPQ